MSNKNFVMRNDKYVIKLNYFYGTKRTKREQDTILTEVPHIQSTAHLILLKRQYLKMDSGHPEARSKINKDWRIWLTFRNKLLRRMKKERGDLVCFFCHKPNLTANVNSPYANQREATLDHYIPQAKGGKKFDEKNLVVACLNCNQKKKDILPNDFQIKK